jgi:CheY-like chemotaxis protein/HPt (histidine-containing phosphotransfer) domain-containing protein
MNEQPAVTQALPLAILVVDDDELNQRMMRLILKRDGHLVETALNGAEALAAVKSKHFDIVLMDLQMPVMDGIEASRRIRQLEHGKRRTFIVALTASYLPEKGRELFEAGIDNYMAKPFDVAHLRNILQHGLARRNSSVVSKVDEPVSELPGREQNLDVDFRVGTERVGGNSDVYKELLSDFINELPDKVEQLWSNYRSGDLNGLYRGAHNLKGVSANLGAMRLSAHAQTLEKQVSQGYTESIETLLNDISPIVRQLEEIAKNYLQPGSTAP